MGQRLAAQDSPEAAVERARLLAVERRRVADLEALIEQAQEQGQTFLRIMAHDLKTPLTNIQGYAQLAQRLRSCPTTRENSNGNESDDRLCAALDKIIDNCRRLQRLVESLQEAFRLGSGATFTITLPLAQPEAATGDISGPAPPDAPATTGPAS